MGVVELSDQLEARQRRDSRNALEAARQAQKALSNLQVDLGPIDLTIGLTDFQRNRISHSQGRSRSLLAIIDHPFHAMAEVIVELQDGKGGYREQKQLWYANEQSVTNEIFSTEDGRLSVLSWTHPGVQVALTAKLGKLKDISAIGYKLASVEPVARALFDAVLPQISGIYEPGGSVRAQPQRTTATGLKAVKLRMTPEQVDAFISRMDGLMIVTGAPGSGKTTVAFQRIRFLFDQHKDFAGPDRAEYRPELTKIFLANPNLVEYSRALLVEQLGIPASVVTLVEPFINQYLDGVWRYKNEARPRQRKLSDLELRARRAYFGLCDLRALRGLWRTYETQIAERLTSEDAEWRRTTSSEKSDMLHRALVTAARRGGAAEDPARSSLSMDRVYAQVRHQYAALRQDLAAPQREKFDQAFQRWLYWVYDPLCALAAYFSPLRTEGATRIRKGTGTRADEAAILAAMVSDWQDRQFGPEEKPWLAWLLRFALPISIDAQDRFRDIPHATQDADSAGDRWTHVVVDEAQDLSVVEASLISSFVHPDGAVTVSADFRQVVSPVHGMENPEAFNIGCGLRDGKARHQFPFARNMRQSRQIGQFLQSYHQAAFGQVADFDVNMSLDDAKPQLVLARRSDHSLRIGQMVTVLSRSPSIQSIAVVQINEDEQELIKLRTDLERQGRKLAPLWAPFGEGLITTSVERIKGLEYDACIVLGLDDVERQSLNFTLNRSYVALSRPARRLFLVCEDYPALLKHVDHALFDVRRG